MLRNLGPRAGLGLAALVLSAIFGVSSANAAVTSSHVTVPSSPSFFQENENNTDGPRASDHDLGHDDQQWDGRERRSDLHLPERDRDDERQHD